VAKLVLQKKESEIEGEKERKKVSFLVPDLRVASVGRHHRDRTEDRARLVVGAGRRHSRRRRRRRSRPRPRGSLQPEVSEDLSDAVRPTTTDPKFRRRTQRKNSRKKERKK